MLILRPETCPICQRRYETAVTPGVCPFCAAAEMAAGIPGASIEYDGEEFPCPHRGPQIDEEACQLCGRRGQIVPVHACALHTECTLRRYRAGQSIPACITCPDRPE